MAYTPPSDVLAVAGNRYFIVAIPDDEAYVRAALGAYSDLANEWMWGEEKTDPDAFTIRQQWLDAITETIEAWEMGGFTTLIGHIDEIETLLSQLKSISGCCPDNLTYGPTTIRDNPDGYAYSGEDFPATWGEATAPADVDDWRELVCGQAHTYVDWLVSVGINIDQAVTDQLLTIGIIASLLGALATGGIAVLVAAAVAGTVFKEILSSWSSDLFTDAGDAIESARADVICAFLSGDPDNVRDAIEAVVSASAWNLLYNWIDYESAINTAFYGEAEGQYLTPRLGEECPCGGGDYAWDTGVETFEASNGLFEGDSVRTLFSANNFPSPDASLYGRFYNPRSADHTDDVWYRRGMHDTLPGVTDSDSVTVTDVYFDLYVGTSYAPKTLTLTVTDDIANEVTDLLTLATPGTWVSIHVVGEATRAGSQGQLTLVQIRGDWNGNDDVNPTPTNQATIDNLRIVGYGNYA